MTLASENTDHYDDHLDHDYHADHDDPGEKLLVKPFGKCMMTSRGLRTLSNGPQTPTQWKSESINN